MFRAKRLLPTLRLVPETIDDSLTRIPYLPLSIISSFFETSQDVFSLMLTCRCMYVMFRTPELSKEACPCAVFGTDLTSTSLPHHRFPFVRVLRICGKQPGVSRLAQFLRNDASQLFPYLDGFVLDAETKPSETRRRVRRRYFSRSYYYSSRRSSDRGFSTLSVVRLLDRFRHNSFHLSQLRVLSSYDEGVMPTYRRSGSWKTWPNLRRVCGGGGARRGVRRVKSRSYIERILDGCPCLRTLSLRPYYADFDRSQFLLVDIAGSSLTLELERIPQYPNLREVVFESRLEFKRRFGFNFLAHSFPRLRVLKLRNCMNRTSEFVSDSELPFESLRGLSISGSPIGSTSFFRLLASCPGLRKFSCKKSGIYVSPEDCRSEMVTCTSMSCLKIAGNQISFSGLWGLCLRFPNLRRLDVSSCGLQRTRDEIEKMTVLEYPELEVLQMGENSVGDESMRVILSSFPNLRSLVCPKNSLSMAFRGCRTNSRLRVLDVSSNYLGLTDLESVLNAYDGLRVLDCRFNSIGRNGSVLGSHRWDDPDFNLGYERSQLGTPQTLSIPNRLQLRALLLSGNLIRWNPLLKILGATSNSLQHLEFANSSVSGNDMILVREIGSCPSVLPRNGRNRHRVSRCDSDGWRVVKQKRPSRQKCRPAARPRVESSPSIICPKVHFLRFGAGNFSLRCLDFLFQMFPNVRLVEGTGIVQKAILRLQVDRLVKKRGMKDLQSCQISFRTAESMAEELARREEVRFEIEMDRKQEYYGFYGRHHAVPMCRDARYADL